MIHYNCDYYRLPDYKDEQLVNTLNKTKNIIVKFTPIEIEYQSIRHLFDKCIILYRDNIKEQAESWLYADKVKKLFEPYTIEDNFLKDNKKEIDLKIQTIKKENEKLKSCTDSLHITYEDLYYSSKGINEIENYLETKFSFKIDNKKKYRNSKKTLI
jgi:hypothetical protein